MTGWIILGLFVAGLAFLVMGWLASNEEGQSADVRMGGAPLMFFGAALIAIGVLTLIGAGIWSLM